MPLFYGNIIRRKYNHMEKNFIIWNTNSDHYTNTPVRTLGPYVIARWLESHGHTVKVIDFCQHLTTEQLVNLTEKSITSSTVAIGVSTTFWRNAKHRSVDLRVLKIKNVEPKWVRDARLEMERRHPQLKWILGGPNANETTFEFDWIKFHGHCEDDILKWFDEHQGVTTPRINFDIKTVQDSPFRLEDTISEHEVLPIETSRGCQFKCKFCRYELIGKKKGTYIRNFDTLEQEFIQNYKNFGTTTYTFMDDTANESNEKILALAEIAKRLPFKLQWTGYLRLDLIGANRWQIDALKDSGMISCFFGIESFHKNASKVIGKGWNGVHGKEFLLELKEKWGTSINFQLAFIVGLPGESIESLHETQQWCIDNDIDYWRWLGLHMSRREDLNWKSEFDKEFHKYGYRFTDPMNDFYWESDILNNNDAIELSNKFNDEGDNYIRPASWTLAKFLSLGYSLEYLMKTKISDIPLDDITSRGNQLVQEYYRKQMSL